MHVAGFPRPFSSHAATVPVPLRSQFRAETRGRWTRSGHEKPVSTGSDLILIAGIPVFAVAGSHHHGWTVLRTCHFSKHAEDEAINELISLTDKWDRKFF